MRRKDFLIGIGGLAVGAPLGAVVAPARTGKPPPSAPPAQGHTSYWSTAS